jgi:hypothetical protein
MRWQLVAGLTCVTSLYCPQYILHLYLYLRAHIGRLLGHNYITELEAATFSGLQSVSTLCVFWTHSAHCPIHGFMTLPADR